LLLGSTSARMPSASHDVANCAVFKVRRETDPGGRPGLGPSKLSSVPAVRANPFRAVPAPDPDPVDV